MAPTYLLLVLHGHLPYVRHPEHEGFLEEDWFYEAVAETYVPLLHTLENLAADGVPFRLTLSLSPTLCEMLSNELLQQRCVRYLAQHVELAEREVVSKAGTAFSAATQMYRDHYRAVHRTFAERCERQLLRGFTELAENGSVELIGSAATHAILPLASTQQACVAQVAAGLRNFGKHFGRQPLGFWLPECAYAPGLDEVLAEAGMQFFFLDTHGLLLAEPRPPLGVFAPLATPAGMFAFGRDPESSKQVWSADEGYPGDAVYREFHRDLGFDAQLSYLLPYLHADGGRRHLGFKYHRVTGEVPLAEKAPYQVRAAAERAVLHAAHFVACRAEQGARIRNATGLDPVIVSPYDAELFGHWWWEGLQFIDNVFRLVAARDDLVCVAPSEYLRARPRSTEQAGAPARSSWGNGGYFDVWVNRANDWVYPRLHRAEAAMIQAAKAAPSPNGLLGRALNQCARSLVLAQSSDWPFLMFAGTAREYAVKRFEDLIGRFDDLIERVRAGRIDADLVERYEWLDDAFPEMDYRIFAANG
ncbi:MAG: glycoside hydrolase family 57 protein [Planctomycetota bacterium]|jgi:1,4-alpha-glucan branching enzyme